ncbi:GTP 3',8-cyclase MoaA [Microbacterium sp. SORGH_AS_0888]|uniref:GTP 3',8-cyclase MoaA n=1 Tax=Microbacterium sp. SORGH_AS_0888 TaxID=3041791 RepID=UPI0027852783|nr:GTP 3',8-cyclase MoaA [Microbacterium sp. SORGH_AS_0888]MDQ1128611.1 cyclic pyranopterin phosphate synthase [Microbacterium sp. SORGH_AS_0888]
MTQNLGLPGVRLLPSAPPLSGGLADRYGRRATDMRLSVIDKCNLRCTYCMPADGMAWLPKQMLMTAEEIVRIVRVGVEILGVEELRLTGGEPLVRKDLEYVIGAVHAACPSLPISMTTNAIGLDGRAQGLRDAGLSRINISLDSIHPETFAALTRRPMLDRVLAGIRAADDAGLGPIKINAVLLRGVNDHEAADLLEWSVGNGYELRFIEHMPLDGDHAWKKEKMITAEEIRVGVAARFVLTPDPEERGGSPAERYEVRRRGSGPDEPPLGRVGLISSVTEPFCAACTRTRVTAEGRIRSCLFSHEETDLLGIMREGASDEQIAQRWREAMWGKPRAHGSDSVGLSSPDYVQPERTMSAIGG